MTTNNAIRDALAVSSRRAFQCAAREARPQHGFISYLSQRHRVLRQTYNVLSQRRNNASLSSRLSLVSDSSTVNGLSLIRPSLTSLSTSQAQQSPLSARNISALRDLQSLSNTQSFHRSGRSLPPGRRWKSASADNSARAAPSRKDTPPDNSDASKLAKNTSSSAAARNGYGYGYVFNRLPDLSNRFHRPSKEELLAAATGFWSRLRVRFKWFSIRSLRPFNIDDISAFVTWTLAGHLIWILVGTTTFFSLLIFAVNTVFAQGMLSLTTIDYSLSLNFDRNARWMGGQLRHSILGHQGCL